MSHRVRRPLNLFYAEPEDDRWVRFDRYPRRYLRRLIRGKPRVLGHQRVFLNLRAGLDELGVPYRVNEFRYARRNPGELVCIIGKPFLLDAQQWRNPILFGAAGYSHPIDDPDLFARRPVRRVLVPGEWMRRMCEPCWGERVTAWAVGIDTARWSDASQSPRKTIDVLVYDKILWQRPERVMTVLEPVRRALRAAGFSFRELTYGQYREDDYHEALERCRAMVFLCEHETQGIAYQQALARGVPILAWDKGGMWEDPGYYPDRVQFGPVTSVPYWDDRCGHRFSTPAQFPEALDAFWRCACAGAFAPRAYVLDHLTLAGAARRYLSIVDHAAAG